MAPLKKKYRPPDGIVEVATDRLGRRVVLTEERMRNHIEKRHPEMAGCTMAIKAAIEHADDWLEGAYEGVEVLFARNIGPRSNVAVVVAYEGERGKVLTAYAPKKIPKGVKKAWSR